ncbi:uncharacterized protein [Solanum tuberosum]|uniref:uncharacterized protein n=1 Tax=Solanum tuberosum TaxID=4113 RepID=UPI00073A007B|nr:PREDICTED: uncharacterized protein LOC107059633 [Solanum tuberosum]
MKQPSDLHVISVVYVIAEGVASISEDSCVGKFLATILLNYDGEEIQDYDEVVASLSGIGYYSESPLKLDINFKNRESLPAKLSIVEPPKPELKVLPPHLYYVFLGTNNTLPVIIVTNLLERQAQSLLRVLEASWVMRAFYRRFIKDFSKVAHPLCKLLEKESGFEFDEACVNAFFYLKEAPIIFSPNRSIPFELMCDASNVALGAILGQHKGNLFYPIYYASKTLNVAQKNYTIIEQDLLAVVYDF